METITILHEVEAWRAWKIDEGNGPVLHSLVRDWQWPARQKVHAVCHREEMGWGSSHRGEGIPDVNCSCGFWATKNRLSAQRPQVHSRYLKGIVVGKVALWGDIIEHEEGFRAQFAYPLSLEDALCSECNSVIPIQKTILRLRASRWNMPSYAGDSSYATVCRKCHNNFFRRFRRTPVVLHWQDSIAERYGLQAPPDFRMT